MAAVVVLISILEAATSVAAAVVVGDAVAALA